MAALGLIGAARSSLDDFANPSLAVVAFLEDRLFLPVTANGVLGIVNYSTGFTYGTLATEMRAAYTNIDVNGKWVWRQSAIAKVRWYVNPLDMIKADFTIQRVKLGSNAIIRVLPNAELGVVAQTIVDSNTASLTEFPLQVIVAPTKKGIIELLFDYSGTKYETLTDVCLWGGDITVDALGARVFHHYQNGFGQQYEVSGNVQDQSVNAARDLVVQRQDTQEVIAKTTSSLPTGDYSFTINYGDPVLVVAFDDNGDQNALVEDRVVPGAI